jgi:hypothetical protein
MAGLRGALSEIAEKTEQWAGIPMPLDGERLVIEPRYPKAAELMAIGADEREAVEEATKFRIRNRFWSQKKGREVVIFDDLTTGKVDWGTCGGVHHFGMDLATLGCSDAWGLEQEGRAVRLLGEHLRHRQFKQYLLTGMFMERSPRSPLVSYVFRKLRPTIAISLYGDKTRILAALCQHGIGFYQGTWAGALCPTDDVVAALLTMRADEHLFWKRCNQIAPWQPEAGL